MIKDKYKILALFGKSGAGKDSIQKYWAADNRFNGIISCTTRPPRDYEKEGKDYYFISNEDFTKKVLEGSMLEATEFNNWFYGTPIDSLSKDKINIGVFNIYGIECLLQDDRLDIVPIYIECSDKVRLLRNLNREKDPDCKEICRRFITDDKDFKNISFNYVVFNNNDNRDRGFYGLLNLPAVKELIGHN